MGVTGTPGLDLERIFGEITFEWVHLDQDPIH